MVSDHLQLRLNSSSSHSALNLCYCVLDIQISSAVKRNWTTVLSPYLIFLGLPSAYCEEQKSSS